MKKYLKTNDNEDTTTQNLWDATKAALTGKFIAIQAFFKQEKKSQINNLIHHQKELEKEEQTIQCQQKERNHKDQRGNQ